MTHSQSTYHYQLIARAISYIDDAQHPLSLDDLAQNLGMSGPYFQKLFTKWVGISPKRYQQYLHINHAKHLLNHHHTLLDTSIELNMSSTSRLHDLFCTWEAMTPGHYAKGGAHLSINWGEYITPYGLALAMGTKTGLCGLAFHEDTGLEVALSDLKSRWPNAIYQHNPPALASWVHSAFTVKSPATEHKTPLHLIGAPFQLNVWEALLHIPSGNVTTYSDLAQAVGSPKAVRAVGTAVGRNPISLLIPCHRALRKSGALGGYHWGLTVKRAILARESAYRDAEQPNNPTE